MRRRLILGCLIALLAWDAPPAVLTLSQLTSAGVRSTTVATPPLFEVGASTPQSADRDALTVSGLAPGASVNFLLNIRGDGSSTSAIATAATTSTSTALDTDATNGLQVEVDRCSTLWQQTTPSDGVCNGTTTTLLGPTPLATAKTSAPTLMSSGLAALSGGVDHLRIRFSLPSGAPASYSSLSSSPTVTVWGQGDPGAPTGVTATAGTASASVAWTAPAYNGGSAVSAYTVTSNAGQTCTTTGATTCTVTGLTSGTSYTFTVTATNSVGTGPASSASNAVTPSSPAPGPPTGLTATAGDSQVALSWTAPASNGGSAISAYTATASPSGLSCSTTGATSCTIGGLTDGSTQTITVTATNSASTGSPSSAVTATPYPATLMSTANGLSLWLDGADPSTLYSNSACSTLAGSGSSIACWKDKSSAAENFTQSTSANEPPLGTLNGLGAINFTNVAQTLNSINSTDTYQTVFLAAAPQTTSSGYDYMFGEAGSDFNIRTDPGATAFASPNSNDWAGNTGTPALDWSNGRQTVNPTLGVTSIITAQSASPRSFNASLSNSFYAGGYGRGMLGDVGEVIVFNTTLSTTQRRTVEDYLAHKWGTTITPDAPGTPTATAGTASASVAWTAPAYNGGSAVSAYTVTSNAGQTCTTTGATTCTVTGLTSGTSYTFTVTATNSVGTGPASSASNAVTPSSPAPGPPTGLTATAGDSQVALSWTAPASNGGSAISAYTATASPSGLSCSTTGATSCTIGGLTDGSTQTITVTATNSAGTGSPSSAVTATPYPATLMSTANGLSLWLDGADPSTLYSNSACSTLAGSGSSIACWKDKSSAAENFTQSTSANEPPLGTLNGLGAINFTNVAQTLNSINSTDTYQTVFLAAAPQTTSSGYDYMFGEAGSDFNIRTDPGATAFASPNSNDWAGNTGTPPLDWSNGRQTVNPTLGVTSIITAQSASPRSFNASLSNSFYAGGYGRGMLGDVGEVIVFKTTLSTTQRRTVEDYLAHKWGTTITPDAPGTPTATAGTASASVAWTAPAYNGGSAVSAYTVTSNAGQTCTTTGATTCTVTGLTSGTSYTFTVTATNSVGTGPASSASNAITAG